MGKEMERNWKEVRSDVKRFVEEEVYPAEPVLHKGNEESKEKLSELMQKAKDNSFAFASTIMSTSLP